MMFYITQMLQFFPNPTLKRKAKNEHIGKEWCQIGKASPNYGQEKKKVKRIIYKKNLVSWILIDHPLPTPYHLRSSRKLAITYSPTKVGDNVSEATKIQQRNHQLACQKIQRAMFLKRRNTQFLLGQSNTKKVPMRHHNNKYITMHTICKLGKWVYVTRKQETVS